MEHFAAVPESEPSVRDRFPKNFFDRVRFASGSRFSSVDRDSPALLQAKATEQRQSAKPVANPSEIKKQLVLLGIRAMKNQFCRFLVMVAMAGGLSVSSPVMAQEKKGSVPKESFSGASTLNKKTSSVSSTPAANVNRAAVAPATGKPASGIVRGDQRGNLGVAIVVGNSASSPSIGNQRGNLGIQLTTGKPAGGPSIGNQGRIPNALQHGREAADAAAAARAAIGSSLAGMPEGFAIPGGNARSGGPQAPDMSFGEGGFQGGDIKNPLDRFSNSGNGTGMNIRRDASEQRKGTVTDQSHLSLRGDKLLGAYSSNSGTTRYESNYTQTGESTHFGHSRESHGRSTFSTATVTETRDTRGRLSGTTLETGYTRDGGRHETYKAVHYDGRGIVRDVVVVRENNRTGEQTKDVYAPDGTLQSHSSSRDVPPAKEPASQGTQSTQACDRNPSEGASLGGPTGPSAETVSGISRIDLLRQLGEGQSTGGGTNQMLNGRLGNNQVRPIGETGTSFGGPNRNGINISINPEESVRGGNNTTGGGDRPN
jgi:hypothetical protein